MRAPDRRSFALLLILALAAMGCPRGERGSADAARARRREPDAGPETAQAITGGVGQARPVRVPASGVYGLVVGFGPDPAAVKAEEQVAEVLETDAPLGADPAQTLARRLRAAHEALRGGAADGGADQGVGAVAAVVHLGADRASVARVGDVGVLRLREGRLRAPHPARPAGRDFTRLPGLEGERSKTARQDGPRPVLGGPDAPEVETGRLEVRAGDVLVLVSRRVHQGLGRKEMEARLAGTEPLEARAEALVEAVPAGPDREPAAVLLIQVP